MAPNVTSAPTGVLHEDDAEIIETSVAPEIKKLSNVPEERKLQLVWRNILLFAYLHGAAVYGIYLVFTSTKIATILYGKFQEKINLT